MLKTMGRDMRLQYAASFETCYSFRLLFYAGTFYPIMGALRLGFLLLFSEYHTSFANAATS
jgi:adenylate kinase